MLFTEARFFPFLLAVLTVHWGLRGLRARKLWLLAVSYAFYGAWDPRFLVLLLAVTAAGYFGARPPGAVRGRLAFWLGVLANLLLLGFFKYFDFFVESAVAFARVLGFQANVATLGLLLPVGISFYTFQSTSYLFDVHRGRTPPVRSLLDFGLYLAFFPQLVAGPIVRAGEFLPQLQTPRRFGEHVPLRAALTLFLIGFFKKACLADRIAGVVDPVFASPEDYGRASVWLTAALYHAQIYCDFSGYSDMAIATAGLFGYRLPENFAFPYFARSLGEFWRRWHISLSTWMRDYLYLPLVSARSSLARRVGAIYLSLGVCGLWHGAGWQFVSFGLLHASYVALEEVWRARGGRGERARGPLAIALVGGVVLLTWPVFRIGEWETTRALYAVLFGFRPGGEGEVSGFAPGCLLGAALLHFAFYRGAFAWTQRGPSWAFAFAYGLAWALVLPWVAHEAQPFIYFQF